MNNALTFLGIAVAIAVIGGLVVMIMHRNPEAASADGVDEFQRIMHALAPDVDETTPTAPAPAPTPADEEG